MTTIGKDGMSNAWGVTLVDYFESTKREVRASPQETDSLIRKLIPGFKFSNMCDCGSNANRIAIDYATGGDRSKCLIGMGSYVAGTGMHLQALSTSVFAKSKRLTLVKDPDDEDVTDQCLKQTVALPYQTFSKQISEELVREYEDNCLICLEKKILIAATLGKRYSALLVEPILSGNGAGLSCRFLQSCGILLQKYNITVIVDEVMTGGRVGPTFAMTSSMPREFKDCVRYLTLGKITGCGMVLELAHDRPLHQNSSHVPRGASTQPNPGPAYARLKLIGKYIAGKRILERRTAVLGLLKMLDKPDDESHWGQGCLIFSSLARPGEMQNVKCRFLPKLEKTDLYLGTTYKTEHTRESVTRHLMEMAGKWGEKSVAIEAEGKDVFEVAALDYILKQRPNRIYVTSVMEFLGQDQMDEMARAAAKEKNAYKKQNTTHVRCALQALSSSNPRYLEEVRKGRKRKSCYEVNQEGLAEEMEENN